MKIDEDIQRAIVEMSRQGMLVKTIADKLHISQRTVERYRDRTNTKAFEHKPLTEAELARAKELLEDGASYADVGRTIGRSPHAIRKRIPGYSWPLSQCSQLGLAMRWNKI